MESKYTISEPPQASPVLPRFFPNPGALKKNLGALVFCISLALPHSGAAESLRALVTEVVTLSPDNPGGTLVSLAYNESALVVLDRDARFLKGVAMEFTIPQNYLPYQGSLALALYADLHPIPEIGVADMEGRQISFEPIPTKIQTVYHVPLRVGHGLRTTPYVTVTAGVIAPGSFPLLFRILPVIKGLSESVETMVFTLNVKPLIGDEGAVKITPRYPENLRDKPFTALIDDVVVEYPLEERLLKEGEHHLVILSNDYRNESRIFVVERAKVLDLAITLQDPTPLVYFEAPENALVYFDNRLVESGPVPVEPGLHEVKFQISDYAVVRTLTVHKGKTYRVALSVDVVISETE
jgi:hypothetical protein